MTRWVGRKYLRYRETFLKVRLNNISWLWVPPDRPQACMERLREVGHCLSSSRADLTAPSGVYLHGKTGQGEHKLLLHFAPSWKSFKRESQSSCSSICLHGKAKIGRGPVASTWKSVNRQSTPSESSTFPTDGKAKTGRAHLAALPLGYVKGLKEEGCTFPFVSIPTWKGQNMGSALSCSSTYLHGKAKTA